MQYSCTSSALRMRSPQTYSCHTRASPRSTPCCSSHRRLAPQRFHPSTRRAMVAGARMAMATAVGPWCPPARPELPVSLSAAASLYPPRLFSPASPPAPALATEILDHLRPREAVGSRDRADSPCPRRPRYHHHNHRCILSQRRPRLKAIHCSIQDRFAPQVHRTLVHLARR